MRWPVLRLDPGIRARRTPSMRCSGFEMVRMEAAWIVAKGFPRRAFRSSLKLNDASRVKPNTNGARRPVQEIGAMLPDVQLDGNRWIGHTPRWYIHLGRGPPRVGSPSGVEHHSG